MENHRHRSHSPGTGHDGFGEMMARLITGILDTVLGFVRRTDGSLPRVSITATEAAGPRAAVYDGRRRSISGYLNAGLYKIEQARRLSAIARQYHGALQTIKLTNRAIRSAPPSSRSLFQGYGRVLRDARRRVRALHIQIVQTDRHLRRYNLHTLNDEIVRLERRLEDITDANRRLEVEMILDARRDLMTSVETLDTKLNTLAHHLTSLTAALEVNHIRLITITSRTGSAVEADLLQMRMEEATEQLALLEESLRELEGERV